MSTLLEHAIWWHVYPLGALGAPMRDVPSDDPGHRLPRLEAWLDYVIELGCSGLLLGPIFESASHGYDTLDHYRIDRRLGDDAEFDHLVAAARERGLSLVLDGVFNHVGAAHHLVAEALEAGHGLVRVHEDGTGRRTEPWEGHGDLVLLDHDNPAVADLVTDIMLHWLRRGIAGWRLDVAYAVPTAFWAEVLRRVRAEFPDALFIGEVIHGDYPAIARAATLDSITQYELWKAIGNSLAERNMWELAWALQRHDEFCEQMVPQTFVGNHDVSRIASLVASSLGEAGAALAAVVLMTVPGMPSVYYGDEQRFQGEKQSGWYADHSLRPPLPESPAGLAPYGSWLYRVYQELIGVRRRHGWMTRGRVRVLGKDNTWIRFETAADGHRAEVFLELEPTPRAQVVIDDAQVFAWPD